MAVDSYLQIDGLKGESQDSAHKDWIEILSFSHTVEAHTVNGTSGGVAQRIVITKRVDATSPQLYELCSSGKHISKVVIDLMRDSAGTPVRYMTQELDQVSLSSITHSVGADGLPTDTIGLSYGSSKTAYVPFPNALRQVEVGRSEVFKR